MRPVGTRWAASNGGRVAESLMFANTPRILSRAARGTNAGTRHDPLADRRPERGDRHGKLCRVAAANQPFVARYLAGEMAAFFELKPGDMAAALGRPLDRPRSALASALQAEAERLRAPTAVSTALARLAHPESRVVVTGQQPGLLLGPAYSLSKAMSAIRLAAALDSEEAPVVPVFWVASQDHDTAEVDHANLLDGEEELHRIEVRLAEGVPSGRAPLRREWRSAVIDSLQGVGGRPEFVRRVCSLVDESAQSAETFADWFVGLLYQLLGDDGLIVLDPARPGLAPFFGRVLERELSEPTATVEAIVSAGEELRGLGLEPQLGRGRQATNLFLEEPGEDGLPRRQLLRYDGRSFATPESEYSAAELRAVLKDEPWRLTPAAGLRPVCQDSVLPTAAFVVGPGELRYLAQLRGVYAHHGVPMPLVHPRASAVVLEPPTRRILSRYGLDYASYAEGREGLLRRILLERGGHGEAFGQALRRLSSESEELLGHVAAIDPTLIGAVERGRRRFEGTIELLRDKAGAALVREDGITRRQFGRLEAHLFPGGEPQERYLSPFSFFLKFGVRPMMSLYRSMAASGEHLLEP